MLQGECQLFSFNETKSKQFVFFESEQYFLLNDRKLFLLRVKVVQILPKKLQLLDGAVACFQKVCATVAFIQN